MRHAARVLLAVASIAFLLVSPAAWEQDSTCSECLICRSAIISFDDGAPAPTAHPTIRQR
jgi:hypothetical protein